jgi:hypothetical protein
MHNVPPVFSIFHCLPFAFLKRRSEANRHSFMGNAQQMPELDVPKTSNVETIRVKAPKRFWDTPAHI